jgi:hypothetical protein
MPYGLRAGLLAILPNERAADYRLLRRRLWRSFVPEDHGERELVEGQVQAVWQAIRAERIATDLLADLPPAAADRCHGSDLLAKPDHRAAIATVRHLQAAAGTGLRRALELVLRYRKVRRDGLLAPLPDEADEEDADDDGRGEPQAEAPARPVLPRPANGNRPRSGAGNCTNEFPGGHAAAAAAAGVGTNAFGPPAGSDLPAEARTAPVDAAGRTGTNAFEADEADVPPATGADHGPRRKLPAGSAAPADPDASPDTADADPAAGWSALRRRVLASCPLGFEELLRGCTEEELEEFEVLGDPVRYEAWFARQPKPAPEPVELDPDTLAAIRQVTRHNPA